MDTATYDQLHVPAETVGAMASYLLENMTATVAVHDGIPLYVELPASVELTISPTDPGLPGGPVHRRYQAGHPGDRRGDPGAAVRGHRREGQGRHPRRPLPRSHQRLTVGARSQARKRALDVLYESDLRGADVVATLAARLAEADPPISAYAVELVEGVTAHRKRIDELLMTYAEGWTLERMPPV